MAYKNREDKLAYLREYRERRKLLGLATGGRNNEMLKTCRDRRRSVPSVKEERRENAKRRQQEIYADPVRRAEYKAQQKAWRDANKSKCAVRSKVKNQALKTLVVSAYGGKCSCCGEIELEFLTLDHIHDNGAAHRLEIRSTGMNLHRWCRDNGFP